MLSCSMHSCHRCPAAGVNRRQFLAGLGALGLAAPQGARQAPIKTPLTVQPVLTYTISKRREATSWRPWGGLLTEQAVQRCASI